MKCTKCEKEMEGEVSGATFYGVNVEVNAVPPEDIDYYNKQLYNDGKGGCKAAICYACSINGYLI